MYYLACISILAESLELRERMSVTPCWGSWHYFIMVGAPHYSKRSCLTLRGKKLFAFFEAYNPPGYMSGVMLCQDTGSLWVVTE